MRVCPKCGFSDNLLWRNCLYKRDLVYMHIDDFKIEYSALFERVMNEKFVVDGQFVYHKTRVYVLRKEPAEVGQPFGENFELHDVHSPNRRFSAYGLRRQKELKEQTKLFDLTTLKLWGTTTPIRANGGPGWNSISTHAK